MGTKKYCVMHKKTFTGKDGRFAILDCPPYGKVGDASNRVARNDVPSSGSKGSSVAKRPNILNNHLECRNDSASDISDTDYLFTTKV